MDGISAAASVLALVAAAVQTSRTIYNTVSTIKSGSKDVLYLASAASSLERALHQLSALLATQYRLRTQDVGPLTQYVLQCVGDLDSICEQLWKLRDGDGIGHTKKAWRLLQVLIKKDDIQRMSRIIQQHVSMLTFQVMLLSSQETFLHSRLISSLLHGLTGYTQYTSKEEIPPRSTLHPDIPATLLAIRTKLDYLPPTAATEFTNTKSQIEKIEGQVENTSVSVEAPKDFIEVVSTYESNELTESLRRLSELAQHECSKVHSAEAEEIVEDIDVLVDSLLRQHQEQRSRGRKRKRSALHIEDVEAEKALKLAKAIVNTNQYVALNQKARPFRADSFRPQTVEERRNRTYMLPHGTASIFTKLIKEADSNLGEGVNARTLAFSAKLEYLPSSNLNFAKIVAHLEHRAGRFGSTTLCPSLTVSPVVPVDSEVFVAVQGGDIIKLETLFGEGKASPRDCDHNGRSLLGYACFNDRPEICKYLLEHGANVDAVEKADYGDGQHEYLPLLLHCGTHDPALECQRLLLASGADPSDATEDELGPMELALYNPVLLNHIKYYARHLVDTECRDSNGDTMLLRFMHRLIYYPKALRFLLDLGADVRAQTSRGNSCLHVCFFKACRYSSDFRYDDLRLLSSLSMLIKAGADVCATNWKGVSVSHFAGRAWPRGAPQIDLGSFTMDAWLTVLRKCGYRPVDVMGDEALSHKVRFTEKYREQHFEAMQKWEPWMTTHIFDREFGEWVESVS